jgi:hypothetical protein
LQHRKVKALVAREGTEKIVVRQTEDSEQGHVEDGSRDSARKKVELQD